ncbi:MAG: peroxidase family protein [Proteobacteria bacterium]|nr:peroxidase family protein [Pseudomonadota bacterium]
MVLAASVPGLHAPAQAQSLADEIGAVLDSAFRGTKPACVDAIPRFRSIDGSGNHCHDPDIGKADTPLARRVESNYDHPNPRAISNAVNKHPDGPKLNTVGASDFLWQWGQFLDHDIDLTGGTKESQPIPVPLGDHHFDPGEDGNASIDFHRSLHDPDTGTDAGNPRQQLNEITTWIDASNVYGSDPTRAAALRRMDRSGKLKTSWGGRLGPLLPLNTSHQANAPTPHDPTLFLAGDIRANEQAGLTALHTLFVREHNRIAHDLRKHNPQKTGEWIYQEARRWVGALMQHITYNEFLPLLLGPGALSPYSGYKPEVDASIANVFSTATYRFGHSAVGSALRLIDSRGYSSALPLREAFFNPHIIKTHGIEPLLRGLASQQCEDVDVFLVDELRNFLFGPPNERGLDLAALNIQRGRDHGLPRYNDVRHAYGLARIKHWAQFPAPLAIRNRLASVYKHVDHIDVWVGGLAENHRWNAMVGPLVWRSLKEQFEALRDGDRFWYERIFTQKDLRKVKHTKLSDVIRRNTNIKRAEIRDDVFRVD